MRSQSLGEQLREVRLLRGLSLKTVAEPAGGSDTYLKSSSAAKSLTRPRTTSIA